MYTHKLLVSQEAEQIGETCQKVPLVTQYIQQPIQSKERKGGEDRKKGLYGKKILKDLKTVWNINEFWLYNNCDKIKMYIKKDFVLRTPIKTQEN